MTALVSTIIAAVLSFIAYSFAQAAKQSHEEGDTKAALFGTGLAVAFIAIAGLSLFFGWAR
jgi:hypothetical protein